MKAVSSGGVVIFKGKILLLYKNIEKKHDAWVLPKGTVEKNETYEQTALREVKEEAGVRAKIISYLGNSRYSFKARGEIIDKEVHWYLMTTDSFYSKPQIEEFFEDSGFYKFYEAKYLIRYENELNMMLDGYEEYLRLKKLGRWPLGR